MAAKRVGPKKKKAKRTKKFPDAAEADRVLARTEALEDLLGAFCRAADVSASVFDCDGSALARASCSRADPGGGAGIDIGPLGLAKVFFVRITNPPDSDTTPEIDAVADVRPRAPGDANLDGIVNIDDVFEVLGLWGAARPAGWNADFTGDGKVNIDDLFVVLGYWTA